MYRSLLMLTAAFAIGCTVTPRSTETPLPDSPENIVLSVPGMH